MSSNEIEWTGKLGSKIRFFLQRTTYSDYECLGVNQFLTSALSRIYGTAMLFIMVTIVYIGVKYVNYSANVSLKFESIFHNFF